MKNSFIPGWLMVLLAGAVAAAPLPENLTVVSVQREVGDDIAGNLDGILQGIADASAAGARVVLFPETALSGFRESTVAGIDWAALDAAMEAIAASAREHHVYVLYGSATRSGTEKPYNSGILIDPEGNEQFRYHKAFPESWFEPGDHLALFEIDGIPATMIICHDSRFPELVRIPVLAGARICFYLSYEINGLPAAIRKQENYRGQLIGRAAENGIWLVQCNGISPPEYKDQVCLGQSKIVNPAGEVVREAPSLAPDLLVYTLHPREARRGNALEGMQGKLLAGWWEAAVDQLHAGLRAGKAPAAKTENAIRLALMQAVPVKWDLEANFDTFLGYLDDARGADVFITPECWLDGYAAPDPASTPERLRTVAQALEASPYLDRVAQEARERSMYICFGFTSLEDRQIYNAAGLWNDAGELVGVYHKTHLQTHDLQYTPGAALPVWPTRWGKVGTMICADRRWPETARTLRLEGARLILNPTYGMHHYANEWWMRTRSFENQCFIAFAHPEVSFVTGPGGELLAKRVETPGILLCDIDLAQATEDNHLRDRRPDIYGPVVELNSMESNPE